MSVFPWQSSDVGILSLPHVYTVMMMDWTSESISSNKMLSFIRVVLVMVSAHSRLTKTGGFWRMIAEFALWPPHITLMRTCVHTQIIVECYWIFWLLAISYAAAPLEGDWLKAYSVEIPDLICYLLFKKIIFEVFFPLLLLKHTKDRPIEMLGSRGTYL